MQLKQLKSIIHFIKRIFKKKRKDKLLLSRHLIR